MLWFDKPKLMVSRRNWLQGAAAFVASSLLTDCGYTANYVYDAPTGQVLPPLPGPVIEGTLTVTAGTSGVIPARFMGLSYEKFTLSYGYFHPSNHNLIGLFRRLGAGVLRIGGGSVDRVQFLSEGKGTHQQVTPAQVNALAGFLEASGWQCIYGVNFAASTPEMAAEEVACAAAALGSSLLGIEIGNEPDEYSVTGQFFPGNWSFPDFLSRWFSFRSAIFQTSPGVPITGPGTAGGNHITTWTLPFGQAVTANEITLLTQHYYRASGAAASSTAALLISPDDALSSELIKLSGGAQQLGIPFRLSECNSFHGGGAPGVSNSYDSALWVIDFLFAAATGGASGVNLHGGGNGPGYTPIADDSGSVIAARPEYYGLMFFAMAGTGTLLETQLAVGDVNATSYAVKTEDGDLRVMVVNKEPLQNLTLTIEAGRTIQAATLMTMTGSSLAALSGVTVQGAAVNSDGSFAPASADTLTPAGTRTTCSIPALSAALISIS